jgi:hypothetical protein
MSVYHSLNKEAKPLLTTLSKNLEVIFPDDDSQAFGRFHDEDPIAKAGEPLRRWLGFGTGGKISDADPVIHLSTYRGLHDVDTRDLPVQLSLEGPGTRF